MSPDLRRTLTRGVSAVFVVWGAVQLAAPEATVRTVTPDVPEPRAWIVRVLGARMVLQHGLALTRPTRGVVLAGSAVDALHAASMVALCLGWRRYRRPALVSAVSAAVSALGQLATAPAAPPAPPPVRVRT